MKKFIDLIIYSFIIAGLIVLSFFTIPNTAWLVVISSVFTLSFIALYLTKFIFKRLYKTMVLVIILETILMGAYVALHYSGLLVHFQDKDTLRAWLQSFGVWGYAIFFLIQLAQVILIPIPSQITTIAGSIAFGFWPAFLISTAAIIFGSVVAFGIGKIFGDKVAYKIAEKETVEKYKNALTKRSILLLPIMFLFPLFPDDLLCFIAGSTEMSWLYFITVTVLTRPIGIACTCFFLGGDVIPFSGWGIPVWIAIVIFLAVTCFFLFKYQEKITNWLIEKFSPKASKNQNNKHVDDKQNLNQNKIVSTNKVVAETQYEIAPEQIVPDESNKDTQTK